MLHQCAPNRDEEQQTDQGRQEVTANGVARLRERAFRETEDQYAACAE